MNPIIPENLAVQVVCKDLVARSAQYSDQQDYASFVQLFTEDAVLTRPGGSPLVGRDAILASYRSKPAERLTLHFVTNTVVTDITASSASMSSYVLLWSSSTDLPVEAFGRKANARQVAGMFEDRVVLTDHGWKIAERRAKFSMYSE
ncbi:MAG: nuclear transport factor 2 family protein [Pusillimonas sp.]